jgi:ribose transport system substrate-binding protein
MLALAIVLCLGVFAPAGEKVKIGISVPTADHGWTGGILWWAQKAVKDFSAKYPGAEFLLVTADAPAKQISDVEDLVIKGIKALVVLPHEPAPLAPTLNGLSASGIYMAVVDRVVPELKYDLYVAGDNPGLGRVCGEFLVRELGSVKSDLVVMTGIPCDVDTLRVNAFNEVVKKNSNINILESQPANWSTQKGLEVMENYLQKYPHIDAVWCQDDDVLKGVLQAYKESGRSDVKFILGGAGSKDIVKMVIDGDKVVRGTVTYHPRMIYEAVDLVAAHLTNNKSIPKEVILSAELVDRSNAKDFYYPDDIF